MAFLVTSLAGYSFVKGFRLIHGGCAPYRDNADDLGPSRLNIGTFSPVPAPCLPCGQRAAAKPLQVAFEDPLNALRANRAPYVSKGVCIFSFRRTDTLLRIKCRNRTYNLLRGRQAFCSLNYLDQLPTISLRKERSARNSHTVSSTGIFHSLLHVSQRTSCLPLLQEYALLRLRRAPTRPGVGHQNLH